MRLIVSSVVPGVLAAFTVLAAPAEGAGQTAVEPVTQTDVRRPVPADLETLAARTATSFFDAHAYKPGEDYSSLAAFYPATGQIDVNGSPQTASGQIAALRNYFKAKRYTRFEIVVVPGTLGFDCNAAEACIVKGLTRASYQTEDNPVLRSSLTNFCLRLDLRGSPKVLAEHAVRPGRDASCG